MPIVDDYKIKSIQLDNYGNVYEALQPLALAKNFPHFLHCQGKSPLTYYLAIEIESMKKDSHLKNQQLVINKKFQNIAKRENKILLWQEYTSRKPIIIEDQDNEIEQLSIVNVNFIENDQLRSVAHNSFIGDNDDMSDQDDISFIRMQNDLNDMTKINNNFRYIQPRSHMNRSQTIKEVKQMPQVYI